MKIINKAMSAAISNKNNYIIELREAVHAYNAASHSITQFPPEEIMLGRKVRRGLPLISPERTPINDAQLDERDRKAKLQGKQREDLRRGARKSRVLPGDSVIIQRQTRSKGQSRFSPTRYTVADENNGSLLLHSADGQSIKRHVTQTKRVFQEQIVPFPGDAADVSAPNELSEPSDAANAPEPAKHCSRRGDRPKKIPAYLDQYVRSIQQ